MAIPLRVLWSLRISLVEKLSVGVVFIVGIITMVFAIVRVVSLNSSVNGGQVSTTWLILWAGIEGCVGMCDTQLPCNCSRRPLLLKVDFQRYGVPYTNVIIQTAIVVPPSLSSFAVESKPPVSNTVPTMSTHQLEAASQLRIFKAREVNLKPEHKA
jgi:hypothetical protein